MAEPTPQQHQQQEYLARIADAVAPLAQWLETGTRGENPAHVTAAFAENARDTRRKTGITAEFAQEQTRPAPQTKTSAEAKPDATPQAKRRRRHSQLRF